jgi:hypothetical protein
VWKETSAEIKSILDAGKDFQDVVIQPDPNFIATDEFLTFDVRHLRFPQSEPAGAGREGSGEPAEVPRAAQGPRHGALGERRVSLLARIRQHRRPRATERARSAGAFMVKIVNPNHPITREMKDYETNDELFWDTKIGNRTITPIAVATSNVHFADFPMAVRAAIQPRARIQHHHGHDVKALRVPGTAE